MSGLRRIGGTVLLWLLLCALLPLNGERLGDGRYVDLLVAAGLVVGLAVGVRSVAPLAALVIVACLLVVDPWLAGPFVVIAFLLGRSAVGPRPAVWTFTGIAAGSAAGAFTKAVLLGGDRWVAYYLLIEVVFGGIFPWLIGRYFRQRHELAVGGWTLAEELERGQALVAERARLRERTRIAEDMHDALGHELGLLALRAGALELDPSLGARQQTAAGELRIGAAAATEQLRAAIGVLRADTPFLSPRVTQRVIAAWTAGGVGRASAARQRMAALTAREREVLALVGAGLSNAAIASRLFLVEGTVKAYVSSILVRLDVRNRVQAAILAHEAGLLDRD